MWHPSPCFCCLTTWPQEFRSRLYNSTRPQTQVPRPKPGINMPCISRFADPTTPVRRRSVARLQPEDGFSLAIDVHGLVTCLFTRKRRD